MSRASLAWLKYASVYQPSRSPRPGGRRPPGRVGSSDDHLYGAAVDRPGRPGDVGGALEQRKTIAAAISSTSASRPIGRFSPAARKAFSRDSIPASSCDWSSRPPSSIHISDAVGPGQTAFTSTPSRAWRSANSRESRARPPWRPSTRALRGGSLASAVDATFTIRPHPRRHPGDRRPHRPQRRHHVQLPGLVPVLLGHHVEVAPARGAGVVDEDVQAAEALLAGGDDPVAGASVGDVEDQDMRVAAGRPALVRGLGQRVGAPGDEQRRCAILGQQARGVAADSAARAGDRASLPRRPRSIRAPASGTRCDR